MAANFRSQDPAERQQDAGGLSSWWRVGASGVVVVEFLVLAWIAASTYGGNVGPPIPARVTGPDGEVVYTGDDIRNGQGVFLRYGLMDNGTLWGHGAYLGPDFSAEYLHALALEVRRFLGGGEPDAADAGRPEAMTARVAGFLAANRYDRAGDTLRYTRPEVEVYRAQRLRWGSYLREVQANKGLDAAGAPGSEEVRQLTSFFAWSAWAASARIPGRDYSYTNNFPYDPAVGNGPSTLAVVWSALSLIALLAGIGAVLLAFGRFHYLGWHGQRKAPNELLPPRITPSQRASLKFFALAGVLFLLQVLVGGATAHYRVQPGSFYGIDLSRLLPSNLARTWHLQLAVLWIATAYVGGGLFLGSALGGHEPKWQRAGIHALAAALGVVVFGSLAGEYLGVRKLLNPVWFWFGNQGWEYLELGRGWQVMLVMGFLVWAVLLVRAVRPAWRDPRQKEIAVLYLIAAFAIPLFYLPALFFGAGTSYTIVDTWRFWIIHLWVEGFFELFATVVVATMFFKLGMVGRKVATRVIYLDAILFLGAGILGTGHHWYWTGQSGLSMALSATFSAMEVVPLVLLTLDAWDFVRVTRLDIPHKWTFYFLIAVGVWNFIGAGVFGFLINLPVVSYYQAGTNLTPNHGHAALMGVFGMLAGAMMVFAIRQASSALHWRRVGSLVKVSFWGLNIGLAGMVAVNLFPTGVLQVMDVLNNGYWHARSDAFLGRADIRALEWARLPADGVFILAGAVPLAVAAVWTWLKARVPGGAEA